MVQNEPLLRGHFFKWWKRRQRINHNDLDCGKRCYSKADMRRNAHNFVSTSEPHGHSPQYPQALKESHDTDIVKSWSPICAAGQEATC